MKRAFILCILFPIWLFSTERLPWLSPIYEIQTKATYFYHTYNFLQSPKGNVSYHAHDSFLTLSGWVSLECMSAEIELTAAQTRRQHRRLDNLRVTGRYLLTDDVTGTFPVSSLIGLTITDASPCSLRDPSSFHHGRLEAELFLSVGKETPCEEFWDNRWWGLVGFGIADKGSPWIRGDFTWEKNWWNQQQFKVFVHTLWGTGRKNIVCFDGYGSLRHQSVDIGFKYSYLFVNDITGSVGYAYRVYAQNFPAHASLFMISVHYAFGL